MAAGAGGVALALLREDVTMTEVRLTKKGVPERVGTLSGALMSLLLDFDTRLQALEAKVAALKEFASTSAGGEEAGND